MQEAETSVTAPLLIRGTRAASSQSSTSGASHDRVTILAVPVSAINMETAVQLISSWATARRGGYVCVADVHNVMRAQDDAMHFAALDGAAMITPDGMPLVWTARSRGTTDVGRVSGPDLLLEVCRRSVTEGWRHYFYGGAGGVPEKLAAELQRRFPGLEIAGTCSPPFRPLSADEDAMVVDEMNSSQAHFVWVGLGCPKQERWMAEHTARLPRAVLIGIGAAFDFYGGEVARAPRWMRESGLEWLHRLASEPGRLWRRYLILAPKFVVLSIAETISGVVSLRSSKKGG